MPAHMVCRFLVKFLSILAASHQLYKSSQVPASAMISRYQRLEGSSVCRVVPAAEGRPHIHTGDFCPLQKSDLSDICRDLELPRFCCWIANFRSDEEKYFAACVLDALMYRSKDQTLALIKQMLQRTLPDLMRLDPPGVPMPNDWCAALSTPARLADPGVRLVTAVTQTDPPTKSAHHVGRLLKRHFRVSEAWIIKAWEISEHFARGIRTVFTICGTHWRPSSLIRRTTRRRCKVCSATPTYRPHSGCMPRA